MSRTGLRAFNARRAACSLTPGSQSQAASQGVPSFPASYDELTKKVLLLAAGPAVPYDEYVKAYNLNHNLIPNEVVRASVGDGATPVRAWREYLKLTQAEMAAKLGISQPAYAKQESSDSLRPATAAKIAAALGINAEQLDF